MADNRNEVNLENSEKKKPISKYYFNSLWNSSSLNGCII